MCLSPHLVTHNFRPQPITMPTAHAPARLAYMAAPIILRVLPARRDVTVGRAWVIAAGSIGNAGRDRGDGARQIARLPRQCREPGLLGGGLCYARDSFVFVWRAARSRCRAEADRGVSRRRSVGCRAG